MRVNSCDSKVLEIRGEEERRKEMTSSLWKYNVEYNYGNVYGTKETRHMSGMCLICDDESNVNDSSGFESKLYVRSHRNHIEIVANAKRDLPYVRT